MKCVGWYIAPQLGEFYNDFSRNIDGVWLCVLFSGFVGVRWSSDGSTLNWVALLVSVSYIKSLNRFSTRLCGYIKYDICKWHAEAHLLYEKGKWKGRRHLDTAWEYCLFASVQKRGATQKWLLIDHSLTLLKMLSSSSLLAIFSCEMAYV